MLRPKSDVRSGSSLRLREAPDQTYNSGTLNRFDLSGTSAPDPIAPPKHWLLILIVARDLPVVGRGLRITELVAHERARRRVRDPAGLARREKDLEVGDGRR